MKNNILTLAPGCDGLKLLAQTLAPQKNDSQDDSYDFSCGAPLHHMTIFLPSKRAGLRLGEALLEEKNTLLMPNIVPLGQIEAGLEDYLLSDDYDLAPAIHPIERRLLLTRLIKESGFLHHIDDDDQTITAAQLAIELDAFIDLTDRLECDRAQLRNIAPDHFAEHWQKILTLLNLIITILPDYLASRGLMNPIDRRNQMIRRFADQIGTDFQKPIVIFGSTGSQPATAHLLKKILDWDKGFVILPALDMDMSDEEWDLLADIPSHPQYGLHHLLKAISVERSQVQIWQNDKITPLIKARQNLTRLSFQPSFLNINELKKHDHIALAAKDLELIEADNPREEAAIIALILRESLESGSENLALISNDKALSRQVIAQLQKWDIEIDDEAGLALTALPCFIFLKLIADMVCGRFAILDVLSCLKHPLACGGEAQGALRAKIRALELDLRKRPSFYIGDGLGLDALKNHCQDEAGRKLITLIETICAPFIALAQNDKADMEALFKAHIACAEHLAKSDDKSGADNLWAHNDGTRKIAAHAHLVIAKAALFGEIPIADYPDLFQLLFTLAPKTHQERNIAARIHIWSPQEARLQNADGLILAGLNETIWPAPQKADIWLNREMRARLNMEPAEMPIGQSAFDFVQALSSQKVILTRSMKAIDGNPLPQSPWLLQMKTIFAAAQMDFSKSLEKKYKTLLATSLARGEIAKAPALAQAHLPIEWRPKILSAGALKDFLNDPYSFYAKRILRLEALNLFQEQPKALERGILIHDILHHFTQKYNQLLPQNAEKQFIAFAKDFFPQNAHPIITVFWWKWFQNMAHQLMILENKDLRQEAKEVLTEIEGKMNFKTKQGEVIFTARADRIDINAKERKAAIYDYKTGALPKQSHIPFKEPQLPLEALIAQQGGFDDIAIDRVERLAFINLKAPTARQMIEEINLNDKGKNLDAVRLWLEGVMENYLNPQTLFSPSQDNPYKDYHHLARIINQD